MNADLGSKKGTKFNKVVTVLGTVLMLMPNGLHWYWGNMAVYAYSYIAVVLGQTSDLEAPWVPSVFFCTLIGCMIMVNAWGNSIERHWLLLAGIVMSDVALFVTYFTVQSSLVALVLTSGALLGLGTGVLYANLVHLVVECADTDVGLLTSFLQSSFQVGAIAVTQLVTWYINPQNETPNLALGESVYFTQRDIIERVPSFFLVSGCCSCALHVVGFILIQFNSSVRSKHSQRSADTHGAIEGESGSVSESQTLPRSKYVDDHASATSRDFQRNNKQMNGSGNYSLTPKKMLRTPMFYTLWVALFINDATIVLTTNYYKTYGQTLIHDDHFLTNLGMSLSVAGVLTKPLFGLTVDRLGAKICIATISGSLAVLTPFICFTALVDRWLYSLVTLLSVVLVAGMYSCYVATCAIVFGKTHVSANLGLLLTSTVVLNLIAPMAIQTSLERLGWYFTYIGAGILNLLSLLLCLIKFPFT